MPSDTEIYESLDSALWALGEATRNLVISSIESRGALFRPHAVDMKSVDQILMELFGVGSNAIIDLAQHRLHSKLAIGFDESRISSPVEKIQLWLRVNKSEQTSPSRHGSF